ncbi:hypothetical protein [Methylorubrum populi]|uniref:hypothetical protein n=1 Tax=Methylorubrum populi TaxID=223967 RepID=UPI000DB2A756|nr:hypothetical protein [Methylorubrum populi]PZP69816.1 MAG: hypothetical protein DI590_11955 [Methylorubrum populi]
MLWAQRSVRAEELPSIERLFRDQVDAFAPDSRMLLVSVDGAWPMLQLWVGTLNADLQSSYFGFTPCSRRDLPRAPVLVSGASARFSQIFHD